MKSGAIKTNRFTWNDLVIVNLDAPFNHHSGEIAVVCGMESVKSVKLSLDMDLKIGEWLYTIEFGNGSSLEVPEVYLDKYESK